MNERLVGLLTQNESGRLTRRQFSAAMSALIAAPVAIAAPSPIGSVEHLNHVTVFVRDVAKVRSALPRAARHARAIAEVVVLKPISLAIRVVGASEFRGQF